MHSRRSLGAGPSTVTTKRGGDGAPAMLPRLIPVITIFRQRFGEKPRLSLA
jgi:hypothetical protein